MPFPYEVGAVNFPLFYSLPFSLFFQLAQKAQSRQQQKAPKIVSKGKKTGGKQF